MSDPIEGTQPALLFVPDISGFTRFVKATEVSHARHIIEELLEKLIDTNDIGLQVSEVEGDAILFYRFGHAPTAEEFFEQVRRSFTAFHSLLKHFESRRVCQCGACLAAPNLMLKIVAHYGPITQSRVREHVKLFGTDVIAVHRLLKNDVPEAEYALVTSALANEWTQPVALPWGERQDGSQEYDVGRIDYASVSLAPLLAGIPEPQAADYSIPGSTVPVFSIQQEVLAPISLVFDVVCDLPARLRWMEGAKDVVLFDDQVNHVGTRHRCVIDSSSPVMVTTSSTRAGDTITMTETDEARTMCCVYTLRQDGEARTSLCMDGFAKNAFVLRVLLALVIRRKLTRLFSASSRNLKRYCEELYERKRNVGDADTSSRR